ncbi:hypothetical protein [Humisphaera borealis]|uniref:SHOCT domain-containing protein n=1 Tax=Humisphaera borealis TaxID=2807512 RepID=A0A7M2WTL2_9BACT|nr:hypothetical protein [Humisphaera borealis]QOV87870.1 hypothetical protein IPV69_16465 [Humisphaera borealis]
MLHAYLSAADIPLDKILIASLALVAFVVVGLVVVSQVKKRLASDDEGKGQPGGFTLSDLRALHRNGQMSDEEFERAKGKIIDASKRAAERDKQKRDGDGTTRPNAG